jgi:hypothetical protein
MKELLEKTLTDATARTADQLKAFAVNQNEFLSWDG